MIRMTVITESDIRQMQSLFAASMVGDLNGVITILNHHKHDIDGNNVFGIDIDPNSWGRRPIHAATIGGHYKIVKFYIDNGANVNIQSIYGDTALHFAVFHNRSVILKMLLEANADPTITNNVNKTPIDIAKERNNIEFAQEIEKHVRIKTSTPKEKVLKKFLDMK